MRGVTVTVLRGDGSDRFGDTARAVLGSITGCSILPGNYDVNRNRQDSTTQDTRAFVPRSSSIRVKHRDHLRVTRDGTTTEYVVNADPEWDTAQIHTGRLFKYLSYPVSAVS